MTTDRPTYRKAAFTPDQMKLLLAPLDPSRVSHRSQGGSKLSYLEAHDVKAMLVRVFGFANFSSELVEGKIIDLQYYEVQDVEWQKQDGRNVKVPKVDRDGNPVMKPQVRAIASASVRLTIHATGATYTEMAVASQVGADPGEVADFAIKTAESDAFKRCAIFLGTQFGLSLYNKGQTYDTIQVVYESDQWGAYVWQPEAGTNTQQQPAGGANAPFPSGDTGEGSNDAQAGADGAGLARMQGALAQPKLEGTE